MESQAESLRESAKSKSLTQTKVKEVLGKPKLIQATPLKLNPDRLKEFFDFEKQDTSEVEDEILEALKFYRERNNQ